MPMNSLVSSFNTAWAVLRLAFVTAFVTLGIAVVLSLVFGTSQQQHRDALLCIAAQQRDMLIDIAEGSGILLDQEAFPPIDISDLDCSNVFAKGP